MNLTDFDIQSLAAHLANHLGIPAPTIARPMLEWRDDRIAEQLPDLFPLDEAQLQNVMAMTDMAADALRAHPTRRATLRLVDDDDPNFDSPHGDRRGEDAEW